MGSTFQNIAVTAANNTSAPVDFSSFGALKCVVVSGGPWPDGAKPTINIEINNDSVPDGGWSPLLTFQGAGMKIQNCAARWMRARVSNYRGGPAPVINIGGEDVGAVFAELVAPAGNGVGAAVDVSALGVFKTITVGMPAGGPGDFSGSLVIEVSENGVEQWGEALAFENPGQQSIQIVANHMRIRRRGVSGSVSDPGLPLVNVGGTTLSGSGAIEIDGMGSFTTLNFTGDVTVTDDGDGVVTIDVTGGGGGALPIFGSGVDGDNVIAANHTQDDSIDRYDDDLTIDDGVELQMNGMRLFVNGTLTLGENSVISYDGASAVDHNGAPEGNSAFGIVGYGLAAGDGAQGPGAGNGGNGPAFAGLGFPKSIAAGGGGNGGDGGENGGGAGGNRRTGTAINCYDLHSAIVGGVQWAQGYGDYITGGAGGGGGGVSGGATGAGGGGGAGGGVLVIFARTIVAAPTARIRARGGDGAQGVLGDSVAVGGGGGGEGGRIFICSESSIADLIADGILDVAGGAGAPGGGPGGLAGDDGDDGVIIAFQA